MSLRAIALRFQEFDWPNLKSPSSVKRCINQIDEVLHERYADDIAVCKRDLTPWNEALQENGWTEDLSSEEQSACIARTAQAHPTLADEAEDVQGMISDLEQKRKRLGFELCKPRPHYLKSRKVLPYELFSRAVAFGDRFEEALAVHQGELTQLVSQLPINEVDASLHMTIEHQRSFVSDQ